MFALQNVTSEISDTVSNYVVVNNNGVPYGCDDFQSADALFRKFAAPYGMTPAEEKAYQQDMQGSEKSHRFFSHPDACSPKLAAIFENKALPKPTLSYLNKHLPPASFAYAEMASAAYAQNKKPQAGDIVLQDDGTAYRITSNHYGDICAGCSSPHIGKDGDTIASGSNYLWCKETELTLTERPVPLFANFWFFLDGYCDAHRGVEMSLPVKIFSYL